MGTSGSKDGCRVCPEHIPWTIDTMAGDCLGKRNPGLPGSQGPQAGYSRLLPPGGCGGHGASAERF